jgi:hypothetical protein
LLSGSRVWLLAPLALAGCFSPFDPVYKPTPGDKVTPVVGL